jgi:hypothetical protein
MTGFELGTAGLIEIKEPPDARLARNRATGRQVFAEENQSRRRARKKKVITAAADRDAEIARICGPSQSRPRKLEMKTFEDHDDSDGDIAPVPRGRFTTKCQEMDCCRATKKVLVKYYPADAAPAAR